MSISRCPYCDSDYDQDFEVEHEEMCKIEEEEYELNLKNRKVLNDKTKKV